MAKLSLKYYSGEDLYSDGDIENVIKEYVQNIPDLDKIDDNIDDYAVVYHLSDMRENIISWYPFENSDSILEIGAGCGAITGALCARAGKVTAVELSKRRAEINYLRHQNIDNLTIEVGNLNEMSFEDKFDYVILNGVLEYAMSFTGGDTPYETFINNIKKYLKDDGKFIIAIENRLGMKYFSGAPEDHTKNLFLGLNRYQGNDSVRTFSKTELTQLLNVCGLTKTSFFYPYPDYKFPMEIFSENTINTKQYGRYTSQYGDARYNLYDDGKIATGFTNEKVMDRFANSFFVVAGADKANIDTNIDYVKYSNDRLPQYRIKTTIYRNGDAKFVTKTALNSKAEEHIRKISDNENCSISQMNGYEILAGEKNGNSIKYSFLKGQTLNDKLTKLLRADRFAEFKTTINQFFNDMLAGASYQKYLNKQFIDVFGDVRWDDGAECIAPANIDLIFDNIFEENGINKIIDAEWVFDFPIPTKFIRWRALNEYYTNHADELEKFLDYSSYMCTWDINEEDDGIFRNWADHFTIEYVGALRHKKFLQYNIPFDLNKYYQKNRFIDSALFFDLGDGYSENNKCLAQMVLTGEKNFSVEFKIPELEAIKRLRFDPLENKLCNIKICGVNCDISMLTNNGTLNSNGFINFETLDPQVEFCIEDIDKSNASRDIQTLRIWGEVEIMSDESTLFFARSKMEAELQRYQAEAVQLKEQILQQEREKMLLNNEKITLFEELKSIKTSRSYRLTQKLKKILRLNNNKQ